LLPSISPLSDRAATTPGVSVWVPPPPRFRAPVGEVRNVRLKVTGVSTQRGNTPAKHAGILYERKAQDHLQELWPHYQRSPTLHFVDDGGARTCIPDGLLLWEDRAIIFEIKSQHMPEAWWQLRRLYQPVVEALYPAAYVQLIEVVRSFDVAMPFPTSITLIHDIAGFVKLPITCFGVYIWRPSR
jgi:hypothetical protein